MKHVLIFIIVIISCPLGFCDNENVANLVGTATDDGLPNPPGIITNAWTKVSGPGSVTFNNENSLITTATFPSTGTYVLRLTASDSALSSFDDISITVNPAPLINKAPVVNAGPDQTLTLSSSTILVTATATVHGALVTINGNGFGIKSPAKPWLISDFESGIDPDGRGQTTIWNENAAFTRVSSDTMFGNSLWMAKGQVWSGNKSASFRTDLPNGSTIYSYGVRRYDYASASLPLNGNQKEMRYWPASGLNDYVFSNDQGGISINECYAELPGRYVGGGSWVANTWYDEEFMWNHGEDIDGGIGDGIAEFWRGGTKRFRQTNIGNCAKTQTQFRVFDNFCTDCMPSISYVYQDNIYVDTTWMRVMVSTSSTWETSTIKRPLYLRTWTATQITGDLYLGNWNSTEVFYIYVVNDQNNPISTNGWRILVS